MTGFDRIEVDGLLSIESASIDLGPVNVLVGPNGAGKSNVVRAFELLGRMIDGGLQLHVGRSGGASALLHAGRKGDARIRLEVRSGTNGYRAALVPAADDLLVFATEEALFYGEGHEQPHVTRLGSGHRESRLMEAEDYTSPGYVRAALSGCRVFHFHDTSSGAPVKGTTPASDNLVLHPDAGNLAAYLLRVQRTDRPAYDRIVNAVKQVAPFVAGFVLVEEESGRLRLRWQQVASDVIFSADALSDGTLRFVCLATLLLGPDRPEVVVLDEPELGLHPFAIAVLAELLQTAARNGQVVLATQSVTLMNQFAVDELVVVERADGATGLRRPNADALRTWLEEYSLGELWEHNYLGGAPRPDSTRRHSVA